MNSVFKQTYRPVELLVIDDGSTDDTRLVVEKWGSKYNNDDGFRLRYLFQEKAGAQVARNLGLDESCGEFIQFLDSDDLIHPVKFEKQVEALRDSEFPVAVCDFQYVFSKDINKAILQIKNSGSLWEKVANFKSLFISTPLIQSNSISKTLRWNTSIKRNQDMDFMLRYFLGIQGWVYTPGVWCQYIVHQDERISDTYNLGVQYAELFKSLYDYWIRNRSEIPSANYWMVRQYALALSNGLRGQGDLTAARSLALFAMGPPFDWSRRTKACLALGKSFAPDFVIKIGRRFRR